ncbi:cation transporter [Lysinibacillus xylanilyticus]|uniref:Cation transporter n=1 Tax=Lysinibacillus xylanilyticus TaxID=582475 RepID=A0A0K9FAY3_9BACI|nr:cation diffusion facilitator family transporter [Lysinibacillus xylanilyticus]KMY31271.1 cation transporter [Lysinibacillus xylanilyticus]
MNSSKVAFLSVLSNSTVVILKLIVGLFTGSVAILSEAIHSLLDLLASFIAFLSVRISSKPADKEHPYGHGKVENISGTIETLLIFVAGIWIIYECIHKIITPTPIKLPILGILVMLLGALINFVVSRIVYRTAKNINSVAMKSNALHLLTDVYTSLGVALSLLIVHLTGWYILDPIIGIILACYIMIEAFKLMKEAFPPLLDARLSKEEEEQIIQIIESFKDEYIEYHDFRTRRSGAEEYIDFHLVVASNKSIETVHDLCDRIEEKINNLFHQANILIHLEPENEKINE